MKIVIICAGILYVFLMGFLVSFMKKEQSNLDRETLERINKIPVWKISPFSLFLAILGLTFLVAGWMKFRNESILAFYVLSILFIGSESINYQSKLNRVQAPFQYINTIAMYQYLLIMNYAVFIAFLSFLRQRN
jgi:uncharacterized membrane protein